MYCIKQFVIEKPYIGQTKRNISKLYHEATKFEHKAYNHHFRNIHSSTQAIYKILKHKGFTFKNNGIIKKKADERIGSKYHVKYFLSEDNNTSS